MGVPVITLPLHRPVSRQTYSILSAIGAQELVATSVENYISLAIQLALNGTRIEKYRTQLRGQMRDSKFCSVAGFTRAYEKAVQTIVEKIFSSQSFRGRA